MSEGPYIAEAASLIGDPARANMLAALLDGRALTATELGLTAGVAAPTASGHLSKLLEGRLVSVTSTGRHRYYRLASPAVARVLESLMALAAVDGPPRHRPNSHCGEAMARARTCYDHLAGRLGVSLADSLASREHVLLTEQGGIVTEKGLAFLGKLGVDLAPGNSRRPFCRPCLDWSERRLHIGGVIGAAIAKRCLALGWTERQKEGRALTITPAGERAFEEVFGVRV
jgi:DNA-binding transcriptional ArsR family regulator